MPAKAKAQAQWHDPRSLAVEAVSPSLLFLLSGHRKHTVCSQVSSWGAEGGVRSPETQEIYPKKDRVLWRELDSFKEKN